MSKSLILLEKNILNLKSFNFRILMKDPYHKKTLFVQIGCLMELKDSNGNFQKLNGMIFY